MKWDTTLTRQIKKKRHLTSLIQLPTDPLEWIKIARPYVGKIKRTFEWEPFWPPVYEDKSSNIIVANGRQSFKSTFGTDIIGCYATSHDDIEATYIVDRDDRISAWSKQRFRKDTMLRNQLLTPFLIHGRANVGEINFTNDSVLFVRSDENEYNNVQGMTNSLMIFDECQYQDLQFRAAALYSMTMTKGQCYYLGIGGELGSEWHKMWDKSNQNEWYFDDEHWRENLEFDEYGNLSNDNPAKIVKGEYIPTHPDNTEYSSYHMPQTIFARIPLTISDAINKYKTRPENSIEFQEKYNPPSIVAAHVYGNFFKATRRPITPDMVRNCYDNTLTLLTAEQVRALKEKYNINIYLGIDWGSGKSNAGKTIGVILIYWVDTNQYQIAHIEIRPEEMASNSASIFVDMINDYAVDQCCADMGFDRDGVTIMQRGGSTSNSIPITGVGFKVRGVYSSGKSTEEAILHRTDNERTEKSIKRKSDHYTIQKTQLIDLTIGVLNKTVPHPKDSTRAIPQLIIPSKDIEKIDFLAIEWPTLTRKDLSAENEIAADENDPRQVAKKEYSHPVDSLSAMNHALFAKVKHDTHGFDITLINRRR